MHQLKKTITALLLVFSMVLSLSSFALAAQTGTVTADCVRIHTEASADSEIFQQANKGDQLTVLEAADENGWVKVSFTYAETGATKTGYISADYLSTGGEDASDGSEAETSEQQESQESTDTSQESADSATENNEETQSDQAETSTEDSSKEEDQKEEETAAIGSQVSYTATVTDSGVRIRQEANTDSEILTTVPEGDIVTVLSTEDEDGWMQVRYYDSEGEKFKGYMSGEYLDINSIGSGISRVVAAIIRESPDSEATITGVVPGKKEVDIYASDSNWYKIEYQDLSGWVYSDCIRTESDSTCIGYATVNIDDLNLREKASTDSSVLTKIPKDVTLQITDNQTEGWYGVTFNGLSGFVSADYVDVSDHCTSGYVQVTATSLSLRSGAGSNYARLGIVPQGEVLEVQGSVGDWYQVSSDRFNGYVSGAFVSNTTKDGFQAYPDYAEITASSLTLRSDASTDSSALTSIPKGAVLAISGIYNGWYKVSYNGQTGYIDSGYAERSTEAAAAAYQEAVRKAQEAAAAAAASSSQSSSTSGSSSTSSSSSSGSGSSVLSYASQFVGNPYVWGGTSLTNGCDCSGFVKSVFAHYGISLPHSSSAIRGYGKSVSYSDMQPGDVVCYSGHVGIYAGNGQLLSALGKKYGITYNSVNYKKILSIRRMT